MIIVEHKLQQLMKIVDRISCSISEPSCRRQAEEIVANKKVIEASSVKGRCDLVAGCFHLTVSYDKAMLINDLSMGVAGESW